VFDAVGQRTFRFGDDPSAANVVKLSGNFLIAVMLESLGEAFALTRKAGIDPEQFLDLLTGTLFDVPIVRNYGGLIARRQFEPAGFRLPLGLKDVSLALEAARGATVPMPLASVVRDRMLTALAHGRGNADWSVIAELAAVDAGLP
jgi:3-hydroxyisobutyrate dehydrogenase-like beta-hydroxyacid dehydrogenase